MDDDGFKIDSVEKAAWAMRKYRLLAQRLQEKQDMARREHERIDLWINQSASPVLSQLEFYEQHLTAFAIQERRLGRKSLDFPDGTVKSRATGPSFDVDKSVFVQWAEEHKRDDVLRVTLAPNLTAIKESFIADGGQVIDPLSGEIVPGLLPVPESVSVKFEPDMEALDLDDEEDADGETNSAR